ncbi:MAG: hypothetical protein JWN61_820, partial [Pseudonocardiales bacterium]|nr:hypothetical protein [Pseudonocardiales bacterium]
MSGSHPSKGHVLSPTRLRALVALIAAASLSAMAVLCGSSASAAPSDTKIEGTGSSWSAN